MSSIQEEENEEMHEQASIDDLNEAGLGAKRYKFNPEWQKTRGFSLREQSHVLSVLSSLYSTPDTQSLKGST